MPQPSESLGFGSPPSRLGGTSSIPLTPTRSRVAEHSSSSASSTTATTMTSSTGSSTIPNENGNLFTLTNIYTFGDNGQTTKSSATDKSRIHSFVEVFDSPTSPAPVEFGRIYSEKHSTTSTTRKTYATTPEIFDYDLSRIHHDSQSTNATSTKHISGS
ncbi:hypothetical protein I4U23_025348 [Adineta vaga]|nr:hypothetical protein I4U23_025348 [Adineta vaga]